jgi:hypothetical protein
MRFLRRWVVAFCSSWKDVARFWKGLSVLRTSSEAGATQCPHHSDPRKHCWPVNRRGRLRWHDGVAFCAGHRISIGTIKQDSLISGFEGEDDAQQWIKEKSQGWLIKRNSFNSPWLFRNLHEAILIALLSRLPMQKSGSRFPKISGMPPDHEHRRLHQ